MKQRSTLPDDVIQRILRALDGLEYGSVNITVHGAQVTQIDRVEKQRFPLTSHNERVDGERRRP
ncbi:MULTISPECIES: YezD family protein [Alicyclobacillus]|uniref:YezD family protein n=1 Tax=Alicyclobacillus acidoterrestris (strain ATCC 49025 / DSM 3922 / CIP 106132 / NCIMB 13137 / GD3B) TaxID=1356854 RepID=T0D7M6_ALIAG|nr:MULTISPECIES: YezD family protein [Alicyclobacillus]EPZ45731.1 hypothetical protein N007_08115 [Alicyclobacillus acidoterrestris ATCC 49025]UNO49995.1 YezD family protein [Alicyclobacillus acidoterrestris]GEO25300.1 hypothetical protein AAC03nite_10850 [Alicyclobacillus acidoterrestris]